ncbi:MAG: hypothetical protein AB1638_08200 [Nitrospirota bacterium]
MKIKRFNSVLSIIITLLFYSPAALSMETSLGVLGDVVGSGNTEMKTSFDRWISITGKSYPVIDGSTLRSNEGRMSVIMKDGARMEVGKDSSVTINGSRGNYIINLINGGIVFIIPDGINFSVTTPTSIVHVHSEASRARKPILTSKNGQSCITKGVVIYDGKGTKIFSINGTLMIKDTTGMAAQTLTAGNTIYLSETTSSGVTPVQLVEGVKGASFLTELLKGLGIVTAFHGTSYLAADVMTKEGEKRPSPSGF